MIHLRSLIQSYFLFVSLTLCDFSLRASKDLLWTFFPLDCNSAGCFVSTFHEILLLFVILRKCFNGDYLSACEVSAKWMNLLLSIAVKVFLFHFLPLVCLCFSGIMRPGLNAILGPTGSGKSS